MAENSYNTELVTSAFTLHSNSWKHAFIYLNINSVCVLTILVVEVCTFWKSKFVKIIIFFMMISNYSDEWFNWDFQIYILMIWFYWAFQFTKFIIFKNFHKILAFFSFRFTWIVFILFKVLGANSRIRPLADETQFFLMSPTKH